MTVYRVQGPDGRGPWRSVKDRCEAYAVRFPQFQDSWPVVSPSGRWLTAIWLLGNDYRGSGYYGAYPPSYLKRVMALFPELPPDQWMHLFSGSLKAEVGGIRVDCRAEGNGVVAPTHIADATALPFATGSIRIVDADPPYTKIDAKRYGTKPVNKPKVMRELARIVMPGGHLIWLDTTLPIYRKAEWHHWGVICVQRSTNHRTRLCSIFTRTDV